MPQTLQKALAREDRAAATDLALLHQLTGDYKGAKSPNRTIVGLDLDDKPWYLSVLIVISLVWSLGKPELSLGCPLPFVLFHLCEVARNRKLREFWVCGLQGHRSPSRRWAARVHDSWTKRGNCSVQSPSHAGSRSPRCADLSAAALLRCIAVLCWA